MLTIVVRTGISDKLAMPIDGLIVGYVNCVTEVIIRSLVEDDGIGTITTKCCHIIPIIRIRCRQFLAVEEEGLARTELLLINLMITRSTVDYQAEYAITTGVGTNRIEIDAGVVITVAEVIHFTFAHLTILIYKVFGSDIQR